METLLLPDGRTLAWGETGDPSGPAVFYFHGWPASRLEAGLIANLPVRVIAMDRPGYGGSSPRRGRRLLDWPADVSAVADRLGLSTFRVAGVSGGGPYALACAHLLPHRVIATALLSPMPPLDGPDAPSTELLGPGLMRLRLLGRHPGLGGLAASALRRAAGLGLLDPGRVLDGAMAGRDRQCLTPALRRELIGAWREGLRVGVTGAVSDARIYAAGWGFALAEIEAPVAVWHGTEDTVIPAACAACWRRLPGAQLRLLDGEGHYSLALTRTPEILVAMLA